MQSNEHRAHPRRAPRRFFPLLVSLVLTTLLAVSLSLSLIPGAFGAGTTSGSVTGTVFQDFSGLGYLTDTAEVGVPASRGVAGITITATDGDGDVVGTTTSAPDGTYTLAVAAAKDEELRIEFSDWPATLEPGFAVKPGDTPPTHAQGENDTSVQLVTLPAPGGTAAGIDFALNMPEDTIVGEAMVSSVMQYAGDPQDASNLAAAQASLVAEPWSASGGAPANTSDLTKLATFGQLGSVFGNTFVRVDNYQAVSAVYRRLSGLGSLGLAGVYRLNEVFDGTGGLNARTPGEALEWFDASTLTVDNGGGTIDFGTVLSNAARGLTTSSSSAADPDGFAQAGLVGIGGIDSTFDGDDLLLTNLYDNNVYAVDVAGGDDPNFVPTTATRITTPATGVNNQRIFAVHVREDRLYIGITDMGDLANSQSADAAGMNAYVYSSPIDDAVAGTPNWSRDLTADLGYAKGSNIRYWRVAPYTGPLGSYEAMYPNLFQWNSWTNDWSEVGRLGENDPSVAAYETDNKQIYPQPVLASLAFDDDGYLALGLLDRTQLQAGNFAEASDGSDPEPSNPNVTYYQSVTNGDTLMAAPLSEGSSCPSTPGDTYVLECAGEVGTRGPRTVTVTQAGGPQPPTYNNNEGPGGGEFVWDTMGFKYDQFGNLSAQAHNETALGLVLTYPGSPEIMYGTVDPVSEANRYGNRWFLGSDGTTTRGFDLTNEAPNGPGNPGMSFGKAGGLGGVTLINRAAPIEIGNRVWFDVNNNGTQDAGEPGIDGVTVELFAPGADPATDTPLATTFTVGGVYYFNSASIDGFDPNGGEYVVHFEYPTSGAVTLSGPGAANFAVTWEELTQVDNEVDLGVPTTIGSNPDDDGNAEYLAGGPGENDHSIDAGLSRVPSVTIVKGDDTDENGVIDNEADTVADGPTWDVGEVRQIVMRAVNDGKEPLREVVLTDATITGAQVGAITWTFPNGDEVEATIDSSGHWVAEWPATFLEPSDPGATTWGVGETQAIVGLATLVASDDPMPHQDSVAVTGVGEFSGVRVEDDNPYNAHSVGIQVIKYDGELEDPDVKDSNGEWMVPGKPLDSQSQDANTSETAVPYTAMVTRRVRWVVTNTGNTWLTNLTLVDVTEDGPEIGDDWTADLSPFGGPSDFSFHDEQTWAGLLPPGASFFAEGSLTLPADDTHADTVTVTGQPIAPEYDDNDVPTGEPRRDIDGELLLLTDDTGQPITLTDDDPFHAFTPEKQSPPKPPVPPENRIPKTGVTGGLPMLGLGALAMCLGAALAAGARRGRTARGGVRTE